MRGLFAISIAGGCLSILGGLSAVALEGNPFSLDVLWSTEIAEAPPPNATTRVFQSGTGLILRAQTLFADGRIVWLGDQIAPSANSQVLLVDVERAQPDQGATLKLKGVAPSLLSRFLNSPRQTAVVSTLAVGPSGKIWVAGLSNSYLDIASSRHSDAYLASVDETGRPLWEKTYGDGGRRKIRSATQMASGGLAVAGSDGWKGWVARVSADGKELWAHHFGNDLGNTIAALPDDRLVLVGFESTASSPTQKGYQDHVTTWIIDGSGAALAKTRIRNSINSQQRSYFGHVSVVATSDAVYVASNWQDLFNPQPVEVAKLRLDGTLLWKVVLPDTVRAVEGRSTWRTCSPTLAVNPSGDAVVACSLRQIQIYKLDGRSGTYRESFLSLPECQTNHPAALFLAIKSDGTMMLSGSRPLSNVAGNCTWIGRLAEIS